MIRRTPHLRRAFNAWVAAPAFMRMGALIVVAVIGGCIAGCSAHAQDDLVQISVTVTKDRAEKCKDAGGCVLVSGADIAALMQQGYSIAEHQLTGQFAEMLDSHGCLKGKT